MRRFCAAILLVASLAAAEGPDDLRRELLQRGRELRRTYGRDYDIRIDAERRIVYCCALDETHFREAAGLVSITADTWRAATGAGRPEWTVSVVLPTVADFRRHVTDKEVTGLYRGRDRTLLSLDRGRVLVHEFIHALHHADQAAAGQRHPVWVSEGFATLWEASAAARGRLQPKTDMRLVSLKRAIRTKKLLPLRRLTRLEPRPFVADAEVTYAQSRYLMLYLHKQGKLSDWYAAYKKGYASDPTGRGALRKVLGVRTETFETRWARWVGKLELPWGELSADEARLGVRVRDHARGVKVVGFVPGSAGEKAGLIQTGDVITSLGGRAIGNPVDLIAAVRAAGADRTLTIKLLRHGRKRTIRQPMGRAGR